MTRILIFLFTILPSALLAQTQVPVAETASADTSTVAQPAPILFGYLSYDAVLKSMPEYAAAQDSLAAKRAAFEQEMRRVEDDFNKKYESFLEGQKDFPRTILLKRQNELKTLMDQNVAFKAQARQELKDTEEMMMRPIRARLNETLAQLAREFGLALVINTDINACPFIDPRMGMSIEAEAIALLQK